jgi:hypothetical protein
VRKVIFLLLFILPVTIFAQGKKGKVTYKYKKFEKFDFEDMIIEGDMGSPGDLSISPRYQRRFKNPIYIRRDFTSQIRKAVERIR